MPEIKIAFVDDEPNILSGLRRMMRENRGRWEMEFFSSSMDVIAAMREEPFDVVVSDMRMPGMNGAELLKKIHKSYPSTVRIVLSGHCDQDLILQSVGFAHQYLTKPCSAEELQAAVEKSVRLRTTLSDTSLQQRISQIRSLPTPPDICQALMREIHSENSSIKSVSDIISKDVGLTSKLIQIVNSSFFGLPTRVTSPLQAVKYLGLDTIQSLAITSGVVNEFEVVSVGHMSQAWHTNHSLAVGNAAEAIARQIGLDPEAPSQAMLAGFLHDVGKLVEIVYFLPQFRTAYKDSMSLGIPLHQSEFKELGVSHAEIGAYLLSLWGIPDPIVEAVAFHHSPLKASTVERSIITAVHLADAFSQKDSAVKSSADAHGVLDTEYLVKLGLAGQVEELKELVLAETTSCEV